MQWSTRRQPSVPSTSVWWMEREIFSRAFPRCPYGGWSARLSAERALDVGAEPVRQDLVNQLRAEKIRRDVPAHRRQLDDVAPDDRAPLDDPAEQRERLVPREPAGLRRACGRHDPGVA